ncbi:MAG: creatininase family protein [Anaerolineales bacterium]|nr:creatininase family protein [Anaerolineales bacterium]
MTHFFHFERLTWPEVDALPRDCPLVIPFGQGYSMEQLASALGQPPQAGLLPPIPYGWMGSGLRVDEGLLIRLVSNLLASLRDDGFSQVYALTPQEVCLGLGAERIALFHPSQTQAEERSIPMDTGPGKVALIPVGHIEQHAYHLALSTDTCLIDAIAAGVAAGLPDQVSALPTFPYGVSTHRPAFAGTLNAGGRAFEDFWLGVVDTLSERGVECMYLINGHGGNHSFLVNVIKYAGERYPRSFIATSWLYLSGPQGSAALEAHRQSGIGGMGHACELETSMMLHLHPDLVHLEKAVDEVDFVATPSYYMDWNEGGTLIANPPWSDDTATGAYGAGSLATAEKGRLWLQAAIAEKIGHIGEILEQHARRQAKRQAGYGLWGRR